MSRPTADTWRRVKARDEERCVACNAHEPLTFQHRRAVGAGGSKIRPGATDGLTLCAMCNNACEAEMQTLALGYGWKVRKWADPTKVPCYYPHEHAWFLFEGTGRIRIPTIVALDLMHSVYGEQFLDWGT